MNGLKSGARDPDAVYQQYQDYWGQMMAMAKEVLVSEPDNLARAISLAAAAYSRRGKKARRLRGRKIDAVLLGQYLPPMLPAAGAAGLVSLAFTHLLLGYCGAETRRIIELGSGWGGNLFRLWLAGGPRNAEYVGCEYTEAGRDVNRLFARTEPNLRMTNLAFDYTKPDLSMLRTQERTILFTCHSIEQITTIDEKLFDEMLALPNLHKVVHLEPVGWQIAKDSPFRAAPDVLSWIVPPGVSHEIDFRRRARRHGYNTNLVPLLRELERRGRIRIERIQKNLLGSNLLNPGTLIVWAPA
ncbi:MAG: hypothetical protein ACREEE_14905 [Dongiaceae bacterium]